MRIHSWIAASVLGFALTLTCNASPIVIANAIPITGAGYFYSSLSVQGQGMSATGSLGNTSVAFSYSGDCAGTFGGLVNGACSGVAMISDGTSGVRSPIFSVSLLTGSLTLYDASNQPLAIAAIQGYTSNQVVTYGRNEMSTTFAIVPTPEPSSFIPTLFALVVASLASAIRPKLFDSSAASAQQTAVVVKVSLIV